MGASGGDVADHTQGGTGGARTRRAGFLTANQAKLAAAQLFAGIGTAVGFAVGSLLAEQLTGSVTYAGFAQTASTAGAAAAAIPLARLAARTSRRRALTAGFAIAVAGALLVIWGAGLGSPAVFFAGMLAFGAATATGFQARFAATDDAPEGRRGFVLSIVVWATTIGSVAGPNLAGPTAGIGRALRIGELAGPFALCVLVFAVAAVFTLGLRRPAAAAGAVAASPAAGSGPVLAGSGPVLPPDTAAEQVGIRQSLTHVLHTPHALLGFTAVVLGHTVMVSVMVMTPVHMQHAGDTITLIGVVISLHILGMYALSPVFGRLSDAIGPIPAIWLGFALLAAAGVTGIVDDIAGSTTLRISVALILLGLGWSACFIAGSALVSSAVDERHRVAVQGTTDAAMNLGAAVFAAAAGPLLALGGFTLINTAALAIVVAGALVAARTGRGRPAHSGIPS